MAEQRLQDRLGRNADQVSSSLRANR
jgi:hypothetical protein